MTEKCTDTTIPGCRIEKDSIGELAVPREALYGIHALRSRNNFPLSGRLVHPALISAYGAVKLACATTNHALGAWSEAPAKAETIFRACHELEAGLLNDHIIVDALQGGAGTSTNMNVNEGIANHALATLGKAPGSYDIISPLDDINLHQSTNDTYPTALKLAAIRLLRKLEEQLVGLQEAFQELIDMDVAARRAIDHVENAGIVFLDEIDKIAGRGGYSGHGPDVSREGVQRDILPIVEGSTVITKYGSVRTDHVLFIAAGAFHNAKVSDLIPELQGRFPIRVELDSLRKKDFVRILTETECSLVKQYQALLSTEGITLEFTDDAIEKLAEICEKVNAESEDIGARRLHTILEYLLEAMAFSATERSGETVVINVDFVEHQLADAVEKQDLNRYVL